MQKEQIFELMNKNPAFYLATADGAEPRVRGMLLYRADENGIVFHSGPFKDVYKQMIKNPRVEMCFFDAASNTQVRVRGALEKSDDLALKREIAAHPSRGFMQMWKAGKTEAEFYGMFSAFILKRGVANVWTFQTNFAPKADIQL
ncbi:MAG: pyridoxamine 5'-phosphate oxidase family protein [Firmicutes bacterium]|nr:pyridoxamine 5'-phosphate oxidase family protein [Bacillota bacterium]